MLDPQELEVKLNASRDGAAMAMEAILSEVSPPHDLTESVEDLDRLMASLTPDVEDTVDPVSQVTPPQVEVEVEVAVHEVEAAPQKEEAVTPEVVPEATTSPTKVPETEFEDEIQVGNLQNDSKSSSSAKLLSHVYIKTPQAEIAALEAQLNSSFMTSTKPESEEELTPEKKKPATPVPRVEEVSFQPTPPITPPAPRRGSSLRDKIRGLHTAREKLMSATPDPVVG